MINETQKEQLLKELNLWCNLQLPKSLDAIGADKCDSLWETLKKLNETLKIFLVNVGGGVEILKGYNEETKKWEFRTLEQCESINITEKENTIQICVNEEWLQEQLDPIRVLIKELAEFTIDLDVKLREEFCCLIEQCKPNWELVEEEVGCSRIEDGWEEFGDPYEEPKNGFYVKTYIDINPKSCTYNQKKYDWIEKKDSECLIKRPPNWEPISTKCVNGQEITSYKDVEIYSDTYGSTKSIVTGSCPLPSLDDLEGGSLSICDAHITVYGQAKHATAAYTAGGQDSNIITASEGCISAPYVLDENPGSQTLNVAYTGSVAGTKDKWEIVADGQTKSMTGDGTLTINTSWTATYVPQSFDTGEVDENDEPIMVTKYVLTNLS